jgi:putative DNA primase/helicase
MKKNNELEINTENNLKNTPALAAMTPLDISPAVFLAAFGPGPYRLRTFCDRGGGPGQNITVAAPPDPAFAAGLAELHRVNQVERRGVFFVVNAGGHKDAEITRVTAHFVEADDVPLETQWDHLMAFPLPPSIVVRTRKSLHGYWLMADPVPEGDRGTLPVSAPGMTSGNVPLSCVGNVTPNAPATDPHLSHFRAVQKQLAAHFGGDPVIANPSRVMRLPGFFHHKAEPAAVNCLLFEPGRRYTQAELGLTLAALHPEAGTSPGTAATTSPPAGTDPSERDSQLILKNCEFICYCRDHAVNLREPLWYAMITNLAGTRGGEAAIHQLSQADPRYDPAATAAKIAQAGKSGTGPINCQTIRDWGFACSRLGSCPAKCPRGLGRPPLPPWYQQHPRGLRLKPGVLADYLSRDKQLIYAGEAYYQFIGGVYTMVDENHVKRLIRKQLRVDHVTMAQIKDVLGQLTLLISRSLDKLNACAQRINLNNGIYDLRTGTLGPHDPGYLSTIQIGTDYDPDATAPRFMAFLGQCLDPATQRLVQELFGYLLIPETCAQKAFVLVGEGGAGKSTLLWVAQDLLLGRCNVSNVPWQSLEDRFKTAELVGKLANIFADLPSKNIEDNGLFKSITGEDRITAERKNRDPFAFVATARLVFSCNAIPKNLGDRSAAFYRRLVIVPFLPAQPAAQRDPKLKDRFVAEAPGILNWALAGLTRLMANDYRFSESPDSHAALTRYRIDGSSVLSFVEELCVVDAAAQASSTQIYHAYTQYCRDGGLKPVSQKRFGTELSGEVAGLEKYKDSVTRRLMFKGIWLDESVGENYI